MACKLPGFSVPGILQVRVVEWVAIPFSKGSSWPWVQTWVLLHCRQSIYHLSHQGSPYDPAIPFLGIYLGKKKKKMRTLIWRDTCIPMFIAALFTIAKTWKQPKCPSKDEWIKKMWSYNLALSTCQSNDSGHKEGLSTILKNRTLFSLQGCFWFTDSLLSSFLGSVLFALFNKTPDA